MYLGGSSNNSRKILKRANPSTIQDKVLVGYQGWFTCPGDGEPVGPGHHGWLHWFNYPIPDGGRPNTDVWPDVSSYSPSELFPAPGLKTRSGEQIFLFSSRNSKTVQRHFHWMAEHGVDGAFLQRFAGQCDLESGNQGIRRIRDEVGDRVREAAEREGRVFAIMYDVSGVPPDRIQRILERDWLHLIRDQGVLDSPNYLKERGKPVIALWGFGFDNAGHTPDLVRSITQFFRNTTPGGVYIMAGVPAHWRTAEHDADKNPGFLDVWLNEFDAISPWTIGRYRTEQEADNFAETKMKGDSELIKKRNEEGAVTRKVDYIPVVLPGGSGHNLSEGKWGFNDIKRNGGRFLWKQIYNARRLGVRTIYGAMWDEYDEGTAFMPIVEHTRNLPESETHRFLALDEEGYDVPSDWYMRICGFAAEGLRNERRILETFPVKELQDYWSSHPRYEDSDDDNSKSGKETLSGSSKKLGSAAASIKATGGHGGRVDSGGGSVDLEDGQTYQEWLALQKVKEEKDEVPPPPYTLEDDDTTSDPTSNVPPTVVTNAGTRTAAAAAVPVVVTTPEVPPVSVQDVHANVQPDVASSSRSDQTSITPASQERVYSQTNEQSPQPYPPSPGVHHPQPYSASQGQPPQPYPPSGASQQRPQAHSPQSYVGTQQRPQSYPSQVPYSQPYPPISGQSTQTYPPPAGTQQYPPASGQPAQSSHSQYATAQGQHYPVTGQPDSSYRPSGGTQSPHSYGSTSTPQGQTPVWGQQAQAYPPAGGPSSYQGYPTSTGHPEGYHHHPAGGAPPQGYIPPNAQQPYPTTGGGGGPIRQSYPPADGSNYTNQSYSNPSLQDPVTSLANDFGRQHISGPSGVAPGGDGGRLSTPPPQHPSGYNASRPSRPSTSQSLRPPSQSQHRPQSAASNAALPSSGIHETSKPVASTQSNRPRWPPPEWDSDTPPVQQFSSSRPTHRPATATGGANLTRPQTFSASNNATSSALRPTTSMSHRPPTSRPNATDEMHDPYGSSSYLSTGSPPPMPSVSFPSGPPPSSYGYPGQQGGSTYGHGSSYGSASIGWPGPSPMAFPGSSSYGSGVPVGSQYPGGGSPTGGAQFPQPLGGDGGGYFGSNMSPSPPFPNQGYGTPSGISPPAPWTSNFPGPSGNYPPSSSALGFALSAVDKMAGRKARDQVENIAQSSTKLFNKFTK